MATPFPTDGPCTACERWGRTPLIEGLCAPCGLARGDPELVGPFTPSSRVLRELGLPEDCTVTVFRMTATKEGHLYTIELLGWLSTEPILADASPWSSGGWPEPRGRYSGAAGWTHWPRWPGNPDWPDIYQGRARAYLHDSSLFLEATWDHNGGLRYALLGIEPAHPQQAIIDAWHGLPLLIKHIRRGPKHGSRQAFENEAAYREALQDDVIKGRSSKELRSLQPWQIAKMLGISESTMHQTNKDYGINMADIRNGRITRS